MSAINVSRRPRSCTHGQVRAAAAVASGARSALKSASEREACQMATMIALGSWGGARVAGAARAQERTRGNVASHVRRQAHIVRLHSNAREQPRPQVVVLARSISTRARFDDFKRPVASISSLLILQLILG